MRCLIWQNKFGRCDEIKDPRIGGVSQVIQVGPKCNHSIFIRRSRGIFLSTGEGGVLT